MFSEKFEELAISSKQLGKIWWQKQKHFMKYVLYFIFNNATVGCNEKWVIYYRKKIPVTEAYEGLFRIW